MKTFGSAKYKGKILFIYPNCEGYGGLPNGLALLSGCLRSAGFDTRCFDTTFLKSPPLTHFYRKKHEGFMDADHTKTWGEWTPELAEQIPTMFEKTIDEYKPDLIAINIADVTFNYARTLLKGINKKYGIPVLAGGPTPTLSPELFENEDCVDMLCIGEGEEALVELAEAIIGKKDYSNIKNIWVKKNGSIIILM